MSGFAKFANPLQKGRKRETNEASGVPRFPGGVATGLFSLGHVKELRNGALSILLYHVRFLFRLAPSIISQWKIRIPRVVKPASVRKLRLAHSHKRNGCQFADAIVPTRLALTSQSMCARIANGEWRLMPLLRSSARTFVIVKSRNLRMLQLI
jgi:hypothetical protein